MHEGDARALFVVISGKLELSKSMGGEDRVIATRLPGTVYGEVPMVFGTQMQATARALETSRVLRIEPRQYHALAAASPEFQVAIGNLALDRMGGLQTITAQQPKPQVTVVGNRWDTASHDLKRFLSRNQILYEWLTHDDPDFERLWEGAPPSAADCPVLRLRRRHHPLPPRHPRTRPRPRARHRALQQRIRYRHHRRRPRRPRRRRLRRVRGPADARGRVRGPRRPGQPRRGSRTTSASRTASPATNSAAAPCARPAGSVPRS